MALSNKQLANYCNADHNSGRSQCKYLSSKMTKSGYVSVCTKQCTSQQSKFSNSWATGDNCAKGYPLMLYVEQGYDVDV